MAARRKKYIFAKPKKSRVVLKVILLVALVLVIGFAATFIYINFFGVPSKVHLKTPTEVSVNTEAKASTLIKSVDGGSISKDIKLDTSKLGEAHQTVGLIIGDKKRDYTLRYKVVDKEKPLIECEDVIVIKKSKSADPYVEILVTDNSGEKIKPSIEGDFNGNKEGTYKVTIKAEDSSGNKAEKPVTIKVTSHQISTKVQDKDFVAKNGSDAKFEDGVLMIDGHAIINKSYGAPAKFNPGPQSDSEMAYARLIDAASSDGIRLFIMSSYIDYANQEGFYNRQVANLGEKEANRYFAKAGHSDNQSGEAFDLNRMNSSFDGTDEAKWLSKNCWKYGFVIRYPEGSEKYTGFAPQSWHIRYVGDKTAKELYNKGKWISIEEYYGLPSKYAEEK